MPEPFAWDNNYTRWATVADYAAYLSVTARPSWIKKWVVHHTWKPVPSEWRGVESMKGLKTYYRDEVVWYDENGEEHKGWWSAPNLFVCIGSPDPSWDGIFQGTPVVQPGTHAGVCNSEGPGIEVVWNGDQAPWSAPLYTYMTDLLAVSLRWTNLPTSAIVGHRDCGSTKTCPGSKVDLVPVRNDVGIKMTGDKWTQWGTEYPLPPEQRGFAIPAAWNPSTLGKAKSNEVYDAAGAGSSSQTSIRLFEKGYIWYRSGKTKTVLYKDLT